MKRIIAVMACLLVAACATTTNTKVADKAAPRPAAGARVIIVQPDIELSVLTASGLQEPRADWTDQGRANVATELKTATQGRQHVFRELDPAEARQGRVGQLLRLHEAVGQSIMQFNFGVVSLPTKKGTFDWTLGEGAQALGKAYDADYALFTYGRGSYSSGGRKAMMVGMALLGVSVPMGGQQMFSSLVDLKTGRVVWFNVATAGQD
ncbi:MAG: hypothetical protein JWR59_25, partial [Brevundimonas sp.]|nr:hypothetical protein [Brevundimonas sp.]